MIKGTEIQTGTTANSTYGERYCIEYDKSSDHLCGGLRKMYRQITGAGHVKSTVILRNAIPRWHNARVLGAKSNT